MRSDFSRCQAKQSHNAYIFEQVTLYYPWHPLTGRSFRVQKRLKDRQGDCIFIRLPNETTCGLPAWMFSPDCMQFTLGRPHVAVGALLELCDLVMALQQAPQSDLVSLKMLPKEARMKLQPDSGHLQLNLALLDQSPVPLPEGQSKELTSALIDLLLQAASSQRPAADEAPGGEHEPEAHN